MKVGAVDVGQFLAGAAGVLLLLVAWCAFLVWFCSTWESDKETWLDRLIFGEGRDR